MERNNLSPERQKQIETDQADFERQLVRTDVDLRAASPHMHEIKAPQRRDVTDDDSDDSEAYITELTVDFSGILETLRRLPDGAGTSAFVAAYNVAHPDWRNGPSHER